MPRETRQSTLEVQQGSMTAGRRHRVRLMRRACLHALSGWGARALLAGSLIAGLCGWQAQAQQAGTGRTRRFQLHEASIADVHRAIKAKQLTATQLVKFYLARIEAYNGTCVRTSATRSDAAGFRNLHEPFGLRRRGPACFVAVPRQCPCIDCVAASLIPARGAGNAPH